MKSESREDLIDQINEEKRKPIWQKDKFKLLKLAHKLAYFDSINEGYHRN
jgi:hypothetical protein